MQQWFVETFLFHMTDKLDDGSLRRFRNFFVWKKVMDNRWGVSGFSVEKFLSHSTEKKL